MNSFNEMFPQARMFPLAVMHPLPHKKASYGPVDVYAFIGNDVLFKL